MSETSVQFDCIAKLEGPKPSMGPLWEWEYIWSDCKGRIDVRVAAIIMKARLYAPDESHAVMQMTQMVSEAKRDHRLPSDFDVMSISVRGL